MKIVELSSRANEVLKKVDDAESNLSNSREKILTLLEFHPVIEEASVKNFNYHYNYNI